MPIRTLHDRHRRILGRRRGERPGQDAYEAHLYG
jgi:hypothetical protein